MADKYNIFGRGTGKSGQIMRTVYFTTCEGYELDEHNGRSKDFVDVLVGKYTPSRATKHYNSALPGHHIKITHTCVYSQLVGMDFWTYWQYASASDEPKKLKEYILDNQIL